MTIQCSRAPLVLLLVAGVNVLAHVVASPARAQPQEPPSFSTKAELVLLNVTVRDGRRQYVTGLTREAFTVHEGDREQPIRYFMSEDGPATIGLLIDTSGSMLPMRSLVVSAVSAFAETSNPLDEFFALTFDDQVRSVLPRDVPFISDSRILRSALQGAISPRGRTSLYDAIAYGVRHVERGHHQRKILVVVSDGADTASRNPFDRVLRQVQASNVVVYGIRLVDPVDGAGSARPLRELAASSGGEVIEPRLPRQVSEAFVQVGHAIRHAYVLAYEPREAPPAGQLHAIRVSVRSPGKGRVTVHTRRGYWTDDTPASARGSHEP